MPNLSAFDLSEILNSPIGKIGIGVLVVLVLLSILGKLWDWLRRPQIDADADSALIIRLKSRSNQLEPFPIHVRNLPSRLAAVVVAPLGKNTQVPSVGQISKLVDKFIPGLSMAIEEHHPIVKVWPKQFSNTGFGHALFRYVQIPDDQWRGSRWCAVCGPAFLREQRYVIGLVVLFDSPNNMDLITLENDGEWPSVVNATDI